MDYRFFLHFHGFFLLKTLIKNSLIIGMHAIAIGAENNIISHHEIVAPKNFPKSIISDARNKAFKSNSINVIKLFKFF
tara:strand:+ start:279 stop:512 length:234 start_codon:yes stop_codon:yes gene_type:complete